ncbi:MAG: acyltransferase [candidate division Zixibacteria bacterium]|nr:acyltransferase [candidate division Zixibacteria bacterium]
MAEIYIMDEYRKQRPKRLETWDPVFKIVNKITRDWVFGWKLRNSLYRWMGVNIPKGETETYICRETWIDDNFPELVTIEEGVGIGWRCVIFVHNTQQVPHIVSPVTIKRKTLLGHCVTVMPGVTIGEYCQIGCNALVLKDIPPYSVAAGVPAKVIRKLTDEEIEMRDKEATAV